MSIQTKNSYPKGTPVYCWAFRIPITGWVGGLDDEFWSDNESSIKALMHHCTHPKKLITSVSDGSEFTAQSQYKKGNR